MAFGDRPFGSSRYVKLEQDIPVEMAVIGDEVTGTARFGSSGYEYDPDGTPRFGVNVYETGAKRVKVLEGTGGVRKAIMNALRGKTQDAVLSVSKTGSGKETRYAAEYVRDLTDDEKANINDLGTLDLKEECKWYRETLGDDDVGF